MSKRLLERTWQVAAPTSWLCLGVGTLLSARFVGWTLRLAFDT